MPASVIDPTTFEDEWFGLLSDREMLVWIGVFSRLRDDQGRFVENAALARSRLFPYRDVPVADVQAAFDHFVADGRLYRYHDGEHALLQIVNWWRHQHQQWASPSKLAPPEGWMDRIRHRQNGAYTVVNWSSPGGFARDVHLNASPDALAREVRAKGSEPEPEPFNEPKDQELVCTGSVIDDEFDRFWEAYPRSEGRTPALKAWVKLGPKERTLAAGCAVIVSELVRRGEAELRYVPHGSTFLNQHRWEDFQSGVPVQFRRNGKSSPYAILATLEAEEAP